MKIQLEDLTKSFPGRGRNSSRVTAVKDINFEIPDGELIGLLGPSGCGKSTTLNMICGLEKPTSGIQSADMQLSSVASRRMDSSGL